MTIRLILRLAVGALSMLLLAQPALGDGTATPDASDPTASRVVTDLPVGYITTIISVPVEGESHVWWEVASDQDQGWVPEAYIEPAQ